MTTGVVAVVCAAAVAALAWHLLVIPLTHGYGIFTNGVDTRVYRGGARAVLDGRSLYNEPVYRWWWYTYPPFAALVMVPLGLISQLHAVRLVQVLNGVALFVFVVLILRALGFRADRRFWVTAVAATIASTLLEPVHTTIYNGQVNLFLAVLVVGCLTLPMGRWRGIGVGLAGGIKLTPLFFVAYFAVTRRWRAAVTALGVFAATVVIGLVVLRGQAWSYWTRSADDTDHIGVESDPPNQSIHGVFARMSELGLWHVPTWTWVFAAAVAAVVGLYTVWRADRVGATMLGITVAGMTSCAVSPFSWGHHWVWLVPLMLIAVVTAGDAAHRDRPRTWAWWLAPIGIGIGGFVWRVQLPLNGRLVWRVGSYRVLWDPAAHGGKAVLAVLGSASYLLIFLATLAVTLWWTRRRERSERAEPFARRERSERA
ncbi:DUF2029 domain-containing protein [Gordonia sp. X0973]|nr:DUF2029 domain-containing protein [Gordonia sp. X0973]